MSSRESRAFSLIEVMVSVAIVGLLGAGAFTIVSGTTVETGKMRARAAATSDAITTIDRVLNAASVSSSHGGAASFCALAELADGPMDATVGTASGTCPLRTVTNIPIAGTNLRRSVQIVAATIGIASGHELVVTISGGQLASPVVTRTWLMIGGS